MDVYEFGCAGSAGLGWTQLGLVVVLELRSAGIASVG